MTEIKSKEVGINNSVQEIYDYLMDMNNFKELLPQDKISEWKATTDSCSFKIQGAATIDLSIDKSTSPNQINLISGDKSPFPFTLDVFLSGDENNCNGYYHFKGKMNPFMKMIAEKPLTALFNYVVDRLKEVKG